MGLFSLSLIISVLQQPGRCVLTSDLVRTWTEETIVTRMSFLKLVLRHVLRTIATERFPQNMWWKRPQRHQGSAAIVSRKVRFRRGPVQPHHQDIVTTRKILFCRDLVSLKLTLCQDLVLLRKFLPHKDLRIITVIKESMDALDITADLGVLPAERRVSVHFSWSLWLFSPSSRWAEWGSGEGVKHLWEQGSWGQHGTHLGLAGPRWVPCWPHELCYLGLLLT